MRMGEESPKRLEIVLGTRTGPSIVLAPISQIGKPHDSQVIAQTTQKICLGSGE